MLLSNTLRQYIKDYKIQPNGDPGELDKILDKLEEAYMDGSISQYDYKSILNELGSTCIITEKGKEGRQLCL